VGNASSAVWKLENFVSGGDYRKWYGNLDYLVNEVIFRRWLFFTGGVQ